MRTTFEAPSVISLRSSPQARPQAQPAPRRLLFLRGNPRALLVVLALLATLPYASRLAHPSLYADDVVRVACQRTMPLSQRLSLPFNEHLAPMFELVTSVTWLIADGR